MDDARLTQFSGTSGRVLRGALSLSTLVSGICLGMVIASGHYLLSHYAHPKLATLWDLCVIATALARYAVNGLTGQFSGTIFSSPGGSWAQVMAVAGRYAVLCLAWLVPLTLLAMSPDEARMAIFGMLSGQSSVQLISLIFFGVLGAALTPPLFLIAAVGAEEFKDLIRAGHWRRVLGGRRTDLYAMYSIFAGALFLQTLIALPITLVAFTRGPQIGKAVGASLLAFLGGLTVSLLGRLCGFFVLGEVEEGAAQVEPGPLEDAWGQAAVEPVPTAMAARPPAVSMVGYAAGPAPAASAAVFTVAKPVLGDAPARLQAIMQRSEGDLAGAIEELQALRAAHAPHPQLLKVLCQLLTRMSRPAEAVEAANEALPLCFAKGYVPLAADMVRALWPQRDQLRLSRDQLAAVAGALHKAGDIAGAMRAFGALVSLDPTELRGVKGLMQMAEEQLHKNGDPRHAATIYNFLLKHCADSPLAEHMREGLAEAQRRQPKQTAAGGM